MVVITIVTGAYKPTYILGASHCSQFHERFTQSEYTIIPIFHPQCCPQSWEYKVPNSRVIPMLYRVYKRAYEPAANCDDRARHVWLPCFIIISFPRRHRQLFGCISHRHLTSYRPSKEIQSHGWVSSFMSSCSPPKKHCLFLHHFPIYLTVAFSKIWQVVKFTIEGLEQVDRKKLENKAHTESHRKKSEKRAINSVGEVECTWIL